MKSHLSKTATRLWIGIKVRNAALHERFHEDAGNSTLEMCIWIGIIMFIAITVGEIVKNLVISKAQSLHF
ncbi:hypothetical protein KGQ19_00605 [Catenulispora sp. NL8]|uniref:Uncharacterized protein n=1 Tax=Catenulispora pinistramenti TaxID=2705254 RepID=A0ABS5KIR8_9ACTN|nr:hypothetical protein [Catenulispora pinistramenti]MBS2545359.1 hypothetical protein [Catenulispora pinistramenti]